MDLTRRIRGRSRARPRQPSICPDTRVFFCGETASATRRNNRLQGMRGLACFQPDESLARRPRTPTLVSLDRPLICFSGPSTVAVCLVLVCATEGLRLLPMS
jgi:hypothetical protein